MSGRDVEEEVHFEHLSLSLATQPEISVCLLPFLPYNYHFDKSCNNNNRLAVSLPNPNTHTHTHLPEKKLQ